MNRNFFSLLPRKSILTLIAAGFGMLALVGCGMGPTTTLGSPQPTVLPGMTGTIMGGETPVSSAKVILWQTDPAGTGYGTTGAVQLATTTSTTNGIFNFNAGSYTCAPGQFAYVTATGGDVTNGGGTVNPNLVMMAAIGSCSNFSGTAAENNIKIAINELTTIAAAYTLGAFTSVNDNGSNGNQLVYISAPANNNATTGTCTGTGTSMVCTAAGLKHAFANAANLVDAVHFDGSQPLGAANVTVPGNSSGSIPTAVINTLGNIFQFCTNSSGGIAGDSSNCGIFFTDATPTAGTAPANTLSAAINIAHNPFHNVGSGTCTGTTGGLFCLAGGFPSFSPALSTAPHDWSLAIAYSGTPLGVFGYPQWLTFDANDNVYIQTASTFAATQMGIAAMTSNGQGLWNNAVSANQCNPGTVATDTNGNVFSSVTSGSSDTCTWAIYKYSAATGAQTDEFAPASGKVCNLSTGVTNLTCPGFPAGGYDTVHAVQSTPNALALDRLNNLWYGRRSTSCVQCLVELPFSAGSYGTATTFEGAAGNDNWDPEFQLVIDPTGNLYMGTAIANVYITPQTSPATPNSPTYTNGTGVITQALGTVNFGGVSLDSAGNLWTTYASTIAEFTPVVNGSGVITSFTPQSTITNTASKPEAGQIDGHGGYWFPSFTTSADIFYQATPSQPGYNASAQNAYVIQPCYTPASATACSSTLSTSDPHQIQIDSTGAMWVAAQGNSAGTAAPFVVQVFGPTYPTWPQLSYGKFGVMPQ